MGEGWNLLIKNSLVQVMLILGELATLNSTLSRGCMACLTSSNLLKDIKTLLKTQA